MDAQAHLLSLGWAGPGHALNSRPDKAYKQTGKRGLDYDQKQIPNTGTGLVRPLMISQRKDRFGIGKKDPKHEPAAGTEWWLKGFEAALVNIGKSDSERSGTATPTQSLQAQVNGQKNQGLYSFFVKGQQMQGTIGEQLPRKSRKRKSDQRSGSASDVEIERKANSKDDTGDFLQAAEFLAVHDKDEKRWKAVEKAGACEQFEQATQFFEATSNKKRKSEVKAENAGADDAIEAGGPVHEETKEERRARRKKRKEARAAKRVLEAGQDNHSLPTQDDTSKRKGRHERKQIIDSSKPSTR